MSEKEMKIIISIGCCRLTEKVEITPKTTLEELIEIVEKNDDVLEFTIRKERGETHDCI